jgi:aryl-alcohol dehydrogenase-like predicted oxidoreductase
MKRTRNLLLGGAQFGKGYGRHINTPELSNFEMTSLLDYAKKNGIQEIDLAQSYESAANNLSRTTRTGQFRYTTKIQYDSHWQDEIRLKLRFELELLGVDSYQTVLIHNWAVLKAEERISAVRFLKLLIKDGICIEAGVSVYDTWELEFLDWNPDIVQAPLNFYNRQFLSNETALSLRESGTKFVARSIFHQGLLLNPQFRVKFPDLGYFFNYCKVNDFSYLRGAFSIYDTQDIFQSVVIGVASTSQLSEILNTEVTPGTGIELPESRLYDPNFTDPRKW